MDKELLTETMQGLIEAIAVDRSVANMIHHFWRIVQQENAVCWED